MKFGIWIPTCRDLATPEIIRHTAVRAEQLGYDSVLSAIMSWCRMRTSIVSALASTIR